MKPAFRITCLFAISILFSTGCGQSENCDLRGLNLNGNVKSVEIITKTPIPISEWLYANRKFGDFETTWAPSRSYSFLGNSKLEFNKRGNITRNTVYDSEGNQITWGRPSQHPTSLYKHFAIEVNELYSTVTTKNDDQNRVIEEMYTQQGKDRYKRTISYNEQGDLDVVTCNYVLLTIDVFDRKMESTDTLRFQYTEYDSHDNWTKALVVSDGYLKRNDYVMEVTRQITYFGEPDQSPLINTLQALNYSAKTQFKRPNITYERVTPAKNGLSLEMPTNFEVFEQSIQGQNMFQYSAKNTEGYFSFIVQYSDSAESLMKEFDSLTDSDYEAAMRYVLESGGIQIISWNGRGKTTIDGREGVWCSYYHYPTAGLGGTPVKVDIYQFQDPKTGIIANLTFGYDSAHAYEFAPQVDHMKNSIIF